MLKFLPKVPPTYRLPLAVALLLHLAILMAMLLGQEKPGLNLAQSAQPNIIKAVAVSATQVQQQLASIKQKNIKKQKVILDRQRRVKARVAAKKRARIRQQQRLVRLKKVAALKKKRARARRRKRWLQKQRKAKMLAAKRKAVQQQKKQRQAMRKRQQQLQQKLMQQQLATERQRIKQAQARNISGIVSQYKSQILNSIGQNWLVPGGVSKNMQALFVVHLAPGGVVLSVKLVRSSGNAALDQSAQVAIYKSSPLPVPQDPTAFDKFRVLRLTVSPKDVLNG